MSVTDEQDPTSPPPEFVEMLARCASAHLAVMLSKHLEVLLDMAMDQWEDIDGELSGDERKHEAVTWAWRALLRTEEERGLRLLNERRFWATQTRWNPGLVDRVDALVRELGLEVKEQTLDGYARTGHEGEP